MSASTPLVGVLALQGGVAEHLRITESLGARTVAVRRVDQLTGPDGPRVDALVLPGGESSTMDRLLRLLELFDPLRETISSGVPTLGTCAGLILLANQIDNPAPGQLSLGALDVSVGRGAFGPQLASAETGFLVDGVRGLGAEGRVLGALIRAPEVRSVGPGARVIARAGGRIVGVTSTDGDDLFTTGEAAGVGAAGTGEAVSPQPLGQVTGISFHPELSGDPSLHRALLTRAGF